MQNFQTKSALILALTASVLISGCTKTPTVDPAAAAKATNDKIEAATQTTAADGTLNAEQLFAKVSGGVVLVKNPQASSLGSGVEIAKNTFVTNCHVLMGGQRYFIKRKNREVPAQLMAGDVDRDVCILEADDGQSAPVQTRSASTVRVGENVFAIGNPQGLEQTLSQGIVSALRGNDGGKELPYIQTTAPISQGSSGGGLFDAQGRLIGIPSFMSKDGQNLNFAAPIDWALDVQARKTRNYASRNPQSATVQPASPMNDDAAPTSGADQYHARGLELIKQGLPRMAVNYLSRAVAMEPNNAAYMTDLGFAYLRVGDLQASLNALSSSLRMDDRQARAWILMAEALSYSGEQALAVESVERAIENSPDPNAAVQGLAQVANNPQVPRAWRATLVAALNGMGASGGGF